MKTKLTLLLGVFALSIFGQTAIKKTFSTKKEKSIKLNFDYPQLIKITSWDKNEIEISGTTNINNGQNDEAFEITEHSAGESLVIEGKLRDYKNLPQQVTAFKGKEKMVFASKDDLNKYEKENGIKLINISYNVLVDIVLEIKVPRYLATNIESTYGTIELGKFEGKVIAKSIYGSVDATIDEKTSGEIKIESFYGNIYTDLKLPINTTKQDDFHTVITAFSGRTPNQEFSSKFGNVYLRK